MKKKILALIAFVACGLVANAATKYEINIAGTEVTSDNASYIGASSGNDITSGYAVYNASSNTLTCYSLKISRSGSGSYGIHNRKCDELTIVFKGNCEIRTADHAMNLARGTILYADEGSYTEIITGGDRHALNLGSYSYGIQGTGTICLSGKAAIHGNGSGSTTVSFLDAKVSTAYNSGHALESFKADFYDDADVRITGNGSSTSVNDVKMTFYWRQKLLEPYGAYYKDCAVYNSSGSEITNEDIYISDHYVAIINADYFPDAKFRSALLNLYPKGYLTGNDTDSRTSLDVSGYSIADLTGVGYFSNLIKLYCNNNYLTALPTLPLVLEELYCSNNRFTQLSITGKPRLKILDAKNNTSLTSLSCISNPLTSLNVSGCTALKSLDCHQNELTSLGTLPSSLETLNCANNKFTTLTITGMSALKQLDAQNNTSMTKLNCYGDALTYLNVDFCTAMQELDCRFNSLTSLRVNSCTALKNLYCSANQLTSLGTLPNSIEVVDASDNNFTGTMTIIGKSALKTLNVANSPLTRLECYNNALTTLAIGGCSDLSYLDCSKNKLASLDVRGMKKLATLHAHNNVMTSFYATYCSALNELWVCRNNLTSLDLTGCTALRVLWIMNNQIKGAAMTSLINSLRTIPTSESEGELGVFEQSYTSWPEGNQFTNKHNSAARAKRWLPKQYNSSWQEIPLKGDVNGDGKINVSDVTALINMILGTIPKDPARGDINGDSYVNVSDVTALVNIILGS